MPERIILTPACVAEGAAHLAAVEPRFARALELTGPLPLRRREDGFATLFSAIVSQQVSTAAATAIWNRLIEIEAHEPEGLLAATTQDKGIAPFDPNHGAAGLCVFDQGGVDRFLRCRVATRCLTHLDDGDSGTCVLP